MSTAFVKDDSRALVTHPNAPEYADLLALRCDVESHPGDTFAVSRDVLLGIIDAALKWDEHDDDYDYDYDR